MKDAQWLGASVLQIIPYGDTDRIVALLTRTEGRISAFARAARVSKRRFGGNLDLFAEVRAYVSPPRSSESGLWVLREIELKDPHLGIRNHLSKFAAASYLAECLSALSGESDPQPALFDWWKRTLEYIANHALVSGEILKMDLEMLELCGYSPRWDHCVDCARQADVEKLFFSFLKGGVVCDRCKRVGEGIWMDKKMLDQWDRLKELGDSDASRFRHVVNAFVRYTLGKEPKSQRFREEVLGV